MKKGIKYAAFALVAILAISVAYAQAPLKKPTLEPNPQEQVKKEEARKREKARKAEEARKAEKARKAEEAREAEELRKKLMAMNMSTWAFQAV